MCSTRRRILCVDDAALFCETIADLLRTELAADVECALTGAAAVEALARAFQSKRYFDLIVLDMIVPQSDEMPDNPEFGLELLRELQSRYQLLPAETKTVVYTRFNERYGTVALLQNCVSCIQAGADAYLLKKDPGSEEATVDLLVATCRQLLEKCADRDSNLIAWLDTHEHELTAAFGGKVVARVGKEAADVAGLDGTEIGGFVVVGANTYEEARDMVLTHTPLILQLPEIINIPLPGEETVLGD